MAYRVIVCGSRDWSDKRLIVDKLVAIRAKHPDVVIVHGAARGADAIADAAARMLGIPVEAHPADWRGKGKAAGPVRNREMLDLGAVAVYAFKRGFDRSLRRGGTENMVRIALDAGVPAQVIEG